MQEAALEGEILDDECNPETVRQNELEKQAREMLSKSENLRV